MNKFIEAAKAKRTEALTRSEGGVKTAGPGKFIVNLVAAEITDNRAKTAKMAKLTYKVETVIEGAPENVGSIIYEYISESHKEEQMARRYTQLVNQLLDAGCSESKISDEDDETLFEAVITATNYASKAIAKGVKIIAALDHVETDKVAENGKPYYNNYFIEVPEVPAAPAAPAAPAKPAKAYKANVTKNENPKSFMNPKAATSKSEEEEDEESEKLPF